jgi:hypothetical protein
LLGCLLSANHVVLIAEEVETSKDIDIFGRQLIGDSKWLSIDMTAKERKDAGIDDIPRQCGPGYDLATRRDILVNRYHTKIETIREHFWLERISRWCKDRGLSTGTVIVTCGHNHLEFLREKVESRGHTVTEHECLPYDKEKTHGVFQICD